MNSRNGMRRGSRIKTEMHIGKTRGKKLAVLIASILTPDSSREGRTAHIRPDRDAGSSSSSVSSSLFKKYAYCEYASDLEHLER